MTNLSSQYPAITDSDKINSHLNLIYLHFIECTFTSIDYAIHYQYIYKTGYVKFNLYPN
jgi:hypothetical protein